MRRYNMVSVMEAMADRTPKILLGYPPFDFGLLLILDSLLISRSRLVIVSAVFRVAA
jgi:hypothetical protein